MKKIFRLMKRQRLLKASLLLVLFLFTMCITIENVSQPSSATVGEQITITVDLKLNPAVDDNQHLIFGFLAPDSWDVAGTGTVTYTSSVGNGTMQIAPNTDMAPNSPTNLNWKDEITEVFGRGGNYGNVKWVVFKSDLILNAQENVEITGQIQLQVTVGPRNLITQLGYVVANTGYGIRDTYHASTFTDCMEVTGGTNPTDDLCGPIPTPVTFQPERFTYEDIIKINFNAEKGDAELSNVDQVYLCISAVVDGTPVSICDTSDTVKMNSLGDNLWDLTIWPKGLFNATSSASISDITYHFRNETGTIVVKEPNTNEDFILEANCN